MSRGAELETRGLGRDRFAGPGQLRRYAPVFAALGAEQRLTLLSRLSDAHPRSISQLSEGSTITRQGITKHLRVLEKAGLVRAETVGRECLYEFKPKAMEEAHGYLARVSSQWDQALARLKTFVEQKKTAEKLRC
jgi:DNA-binding transcriptional ArsR family regulator